MTKDEDTEAINEALKHVFSDAFKRPREDFRCEVRGLKRCRSTSCSELSLLNQDSVGSVYLIKKFFEFLGIFAI